MPLSIDFIAWLETDVIPNDAEAFHVTIDENFKVQSLIPLNGPDRLIEITLESGYMSPEDAVFWRGESLNGEGPISGEYAKRSLAFYKNQVNFELTGPYALMPQGTISLSINRFDRSGSPIVFNGKATRITSVQPYEPQPVED